MLYILQCCDVYRRQTEIDVDMRMISLMDEEVVVVVVEAVGVVEIVVI